MIKKITNLKLKFWQIEVDTHGDDDKGSYKIKPKNEMKPREKKMRGERVHAAYSDYTPIVTDTQSHTKNVLTISFLA